MWMVGVLELWRLWMRMAAKPFDAG